MSPAFSEFWAKSKLNEISFGVSTNGKKVKTQDVLPTGKYKVIDQSAFGSSGFLNDEARVIQATKDSPVILFGDHTRAVKYIEDDFIPGADGTKLLRAKDGIDPRYLRYLIESADIPDRGYSRHFQYLNAAEFPVAPAAEQTRIANQLDTLLARVQACNDRFDAIPALLKRFRQTVLNAAVSGELLVNSLKTVFPVVTLGTMLAEPLRNGKSVRDGDGLSVLRLTALKTSEIDLSETKTGDWSEVPDIRRFLIQDGDYLVSRGNGSKDLVGRGGFVVGCAEDIAFPDTMIRIRPDKIRLMPSYLKYAWSSQFVRKQIERAVKTTAGIWKLSQPDLESVRFPLPQLEEQAEIVRRVEALFALADRIEARCTAARAQAKRLTPLVLAKAFRGELVPQDPNDEPASALLARIASSNTVAAEKNKQKVPVAQKKRAQAAINL